MAIKKETQEEIKKAYYPHHKLKKFAEMIIKYDSYDDFLKEKEAMSKEGKVYVYRHPQAYYDKYVENTEWNLLDDFYRPQTPIDFWNRLEKQSQPVQMALIEEGYELEKKLTGVDSRQKKIEEIKEKLKRLKVMHS